MERIGVRELRQRASEWLLRAAKGESFEVTDRGRVVALLVPAPAGDLLDRLTAQGRLSQASGDLLDLGAPLPPQPDQPLPSAVLQELRAGER
jgi:prevent-host-death family protein